MPSKLALRALLYQALALVLVIGFGVYLIGNLQDALAQRNLSTGFGFLDQPAGFSIGEHLIPFEPSDSFARAYLVGILNTLFVSLTAIVGATILGGTIGLSLLSRNPLLSGFARAYVEVFRNTPQLVQIVFWYALVTRLPHPRQAWSPLEGVLLSNRGLYAPAPADLYGFAIVVAAAVAGVAAAIWYVRRAERRRRETGIASLVWPVAMALAVAPPTLCWFALGLPSEWDVPALSGFNVVGGMVLTPEFLALFLGLSLYIAAFIAEIVRAGIEAVPRGQIESARSLGLKGWQVQRFVVIPQALRIMIPPTAAQYVSLIKNSSLGVAIGYPELFNVNNTILTLSGHTLEAIAIMMAVYLTISLTVSALMNIYNRAVQLVER